MKDFVVLNINGGMGNQLYQYSFIVGLKSRFNCKIFLGFYYGVMKFPRQALGIHKHLELEVCNVSVKPNLVSIVHSKLKKTKLNYFFYLLNQGFGNKIIEQPEFGFRQSLLKRNLNGVFLDGCFADYRYLKDGLEEVKVGFEKLTKRIEMFYDQHVAVHIRRGDYTKMMRSGEKSNVLNINYYRRCLDFINSKDLVLRIYTDDYEWAKSEFPILFEGFTFDFSPEEYTDVDSLWTMSKHQYLIGANSTFSLWAYYFGINDIQTAMFPTEWVTSIQKKGFELFNPAYANFTLVNEE